MKISAVEVKETKSNIARKEVVQTVHPNPATKTDQQARRKVSHQIREDLRLTPGEINNKQ